MQRRSAGGWGGYQNHRGVSALDVTEPWTVSPASFKEQDTTKVKA